MVKIFFAADAHGSTEVWKKWLNAANIHKPDVLMLCGDLTAKSLVPIICNKNKYTCHYFDKKWDLKTEDEIREMEERLASVGVLSLRCTQEEVEELQTDEKKVAKVIHEAILRRMEEWLDLLVIRVDTTNRIVVVMPGNDDATEVDQLIKKCKDGGIIYPLEEIIEIMGHELVSLAHVTPTPWDTPREWKEEQFQKEIDRLMERVKNPRKSIFNFHIPPHGTSLDNAPELTKDLRIKSDLGQILMAHVGSKAVRAAIEKYQPLLGLHGHIHESDGYEKLGETVIINPGSEYEKGILRGCIIEVNEDKVISYWRVGG
jgi:Icc-related predicted phosphoesterase